MDAGALDRRVTILRSTPVEGSYGNDVTWATYIKRWASRRDVSDGEKAAAGTIMASLVSRFQVRYDSQTKRITARDRVQCDGRLWDIRGVKEVGERHSLIEITAVARAD